MKGIIIPILGALGSFGVAMVLTRLITWKRRKQERLTRRRRFVTFFIVLFACYTIGGLVYFSIYTHAGDRAMSFMETRDTVIVTEIDEGYFFDGVGSRDALIFYPGAKVDEKAYAELMWKLAEAGVDCFLVKMPFHMAFFGKNKATDIMEKYDYPCWYISGHSLGGAMAAAYLSENSDKLTGAVFLATHSPATMPADKPVVSIVGSEDKVINWDDYAQFKSTWPASVKEVMIEGGNHSQFGDYGEQRGDGEATISAEEQIRQTLVAAIDLIKPDKDYGVTD